MWEPWKIIPPPFLGVAPLLLCFIELSRGVALAGREDGGNGTAGAGAVPSTAFSETRPCPPSAPLPPPPPPWLRSAHSPPVMQPPPLCARAVGSVVLMAQPAPSPSPSHHKGAREVSWRPITGGGGRGGVDSVGRRGRGFGCPGAGWLARLPAAPRARPPQQEPGRVGGGGGVRPGIGTLVLQKKNMWQRLFPKTWGCVGGFGSVPSPPTQGWDCAPPPLRRSKQGIRKYLGRIW